VDQKNIISNKTRQEFTVENKGFNKNFYRNFTNTVEQFDKYAMLPRYEYYADRFGHNKIRINRVNHFNSDPPKYEILLDGKKNYLTNDQIKQVLADINAFRITEHQFFNK
jgi:hypothetical protein